MYTFENYKEEYLEDQHKLVTTYRATKGWDWFAYPTVDQLRQNFSGDNFTADTRHYAFDSGKLIGFVSSAIQNQEQGLANLQFPFVINDSEELQKELLDQAITSLRAREAKEVVSNIPAHWKGAGENLERLGYSKGDVVNNQINIYGKNFDYSNYQPEEYALFSEVDPVADREALIDVFETEMTQTREQIGAVIDGWAENPPQNLLFNTIVKVNGKIVTHSMGFENPASGIASMTHISVYDEEYTHLREIQYKYQAQRLKDQGYDKIRIFGFLSDPSQDYNFEGLIVDPVTQYKLTI